jgi:ABC-type Mn2+/Zn2+ transport system permease subunit
MYETNVMVRLFSRRFTPKQSLVLQILFETVIIFSGSIFSLRLDVSSTGIISLVFGIAHMTAWRSNKKFIAA